MSIRLLCLSRSKQQSNRLPVRSSAAHSSHTPDNAVITQATTTIPLSVAHHRQPLTPRATSSGLHFGWAWKNSKTEATGGSVDIITEEQFDSLGRFPRSRIRTVHRISSLDHLRYDALSRPSPSRRRQRGTMQYAYSGNQTTTTDPRACSAELTTRSRPPCPRG